MKEIQNLLTFVGPADSALFNALFAGSIASVLFALIVLFRAYLVAKEKSRCLEDYCSTLLDEQANLHETLRSVEREKTELKLKSGSLEEVYNEALRDHANYIANSQEEIEVLRRGISSKEDCRVAYSPLTKKPVFYYDRCVVEKFQNSDMYFFRYLKDSSFESNLIISGVLDPNRFLEINKIRIRATGKEHDISKFFSQVKIEFVSGSRRLFSTLGDCHQNIEKFGYDTFIRHYNPGLIEIGPGESIEVVLSFEPSSGFYNHEPRFTNGIDVTIILDGNTKD